METKERRRIAELPRQIANKIAAGEVVDRPLSIVKELVENAIDAGANSIVIEIKNGGKSYLRVTDNGCGIEKEDVELAFKRHATSKIREVSDLDEISSLGFRGEALASIAAVSRTELITRTGQEKSGIRIRLEGGEVAEKVDTGCPEGTTVIIEDLFYNTPARLKFMKTDATESTLIIDFISKMALAYPEIKMRMINNGNILFSTTGKGDAYANILTIYSKDLGERLIPISAQEEGISLTGFVSPPNQSKTNRKHQIFFVNGRSIVSKVMENGINDGYTERLFEGRFPIAFLFLQLSPGRLDVNIHPNKREVRFADERRIREFISSAIRSCLEQKEALTEVRASQLFPEKGAPQKINQRMTTDVPGSGRNNGGVRSNGTGTANPFALHAQVKSERQSEAQVDIKKLLSTKREEAQKQQQINAYSTAGEKESRNDTKQQPQPSMVQEGPSAAPLSQEGKEKEGPEKAAGAAASLLQSLGNIQRENKPFAVQNIQVTGSIFGTYITGADEDSFYLIDQHAAHERVFYEELLNAYQKEEKLQQLLLTPLVINLSYGTKNDSAVMLDFLGNMGFQLEEFGPAAYLVKAVPLFMELDEAQEFLHFLLDNLSEEEELTDQKKVERIITQACKKAVKAHDLLEMAEIRKLIEDLSRTKNPYSCPHGRPTVIRMRKYEIEKMFKRV